MPADVYLAGSLFTASERTWNSWLAGELRRRGLQVCLPQEQVSAAVAPGNVDYERIFRLCLEGLEDSKTVLALLEGAEVDSGTAFECGYAFKLGRPILGVRTDLRTQNEDAGLNTMLRRACSALVIIPAHRPAEEIVTGIMQELRSISITLASKRV